MTAARGLLILVAGALGSACLVSFDGYSPLGNSGEASAGSGAGEGGSSAAGNDGGSESSAAGEPAEGGQAGSESHGGQGEGGSGGAITGGSDSGMGAGGASNGGSASGGSGNGGSESGGGNGGSGGSSPKTCPLTLPGPPLIEIPKPGGGFYCMDRTEVTNEDYAAFLASNPSTAGQIAACSFNSTFAPDTTQACAAEEVDKYDPIARPKSPVGCVDWCDAKRYCEWAGKRLCGAITGGPNPPASFADANASQWYRACSEGGTQKFPYGNAYQPTWCNGADVAGFHAAPVASLPACTGGYAGLFDLSGNVAEWEDSCSGNAGANDNCLIRGGSIDDLDVNPPTLACNSSTVSDATPSPATAKRSAKDDLIGVRCCLDP